MEKSKPRPICSACQLRPVGINRYYAGQVYYRNRCDACIRKNRKLKPKKPRWTLKGYQKKPQCDRCGFKAKFSNQLLVFHIDGNLNNTNLNNLRTVCLNCSIEVNKVEFTWRRGDLEPDS